jgi:hypothetical protein
MFRLHRFDKFLSAHTPRKAIKTIGRKLNFGNFFGGDFSFSHPSHCHFLISFVASSVTQVKMFPFPILSLASQNVKNVKKRVEHIRFVKGLKNICKKG